MTQFQFEVICKTLDSAVPALAPELCSALNNLIVSYNKLVAENAQLKDKCDCGDECECKHTAKEPAKA